MKCKETTCSCGHEHSHVATGTSHEHEHGGSCGCGHEHHTHEHEHGDSCDCGHEHHTHEHEHGGSCGCGHEHHTHEHEHGDNCGCGHEHHHTHEHEHGGSCGCGHEHHTHKHEHGDNCGCGHEHHHTHEHGAGCTCGIDHGDNTKRSLAFLLISLAALVVSFLNPAERWGMEIFHYLNPAWVAVILCGLPIFKGAYKGVVREHTVNSALLISVAMTASIVLEFLQLAGMNIGGDHSESYLFAAGEIALLMALGELLEEYTVKKSRAGIERLVSLSPDTALLMADGGQREVPVSQLKIGDTVLVQPNSIIPVDGDIVTGVTAVNQAAMTGESVPVDKAPGDEVFAGTQNQSGALTVRVTKLSQDMAVRKLVSLVEEAEGKKAPISRVADRWASKIVPAAVILSLAVALFTYFALDVPLTMALVRGVTILVVFCPCALALATPTAVAAGLGNAARRGILVKSGAAIEQAAKIDTFAFDKTGTLTEGSIAVDGFYADGMEQRELVQLAGIAEKHSEHPIAQAIVRYAGGGDSLPDPDQTDSIMGVGVEAVVQGRKVLLCKWAHAEERYTPSAACREQAQAWLEQGKTVNAVAVNGQVCGIISISDVLRPEAGQAVAGLKELGIQSVMLTGDNEHTARRIAGQTGLSGYYYSLMPDQKVKKVEELKSQGHKVCMVGDGVNDAPALATADCSVAMGALGSDVAVETADAALMSSDVRRLPGFISLSRRVMLTVKLNIVLSILINIGAVIFSTFGYLTPVTGALVHNASSVFVVLNSCLLLTVKDRYVKEQVLPEFPTEPVTAK